MIDPYESPISDPGTESTTTKGGFGKILKEYLSFSGSFSRAELLIAAVVIVVLYLVRPVLFVLFPENISPWLFLISSFLLYIMWGIALGKRSRDLGTTFTYGMVVGMLIPIIGFIFLFQGGAKYKASLVSRDNEAEQVAASDR